MVEEIISELQEKLGPEKCRENESEHSRLRKSSVEKYRPGMDMTCSGNWKEVVFILGSIPLYYKYKNENLKRMTVFWTFIP